MASGICPQIKMRPSEHTIGGSPSIIPLVSSFGTANLRNIVCNSHTPVLLRLLACKEEKETSGKCPFALPPHTSHINKDAAKSVCDEPRGKLFPQVYFRHEKWDSKARSCIIAFIEGTRLHKTDVLFDIFSNAVQWLDIARENPHFHIVCFGDPQFDHVISKAYKDIDEKIRSVYSGYLKDEDISFITYAHRKATNLTLTHTIKFAVKVQ